jgi:hypothetical protein
MEPVMLTLLLLASSALAGEPVKCNSYILGGYYGTPEGERHDLGVNGAAWIVDRGKTIEVTYPYGDTDIYTVKSVTLRGEKISMARATVRGRKETHYFSHFGEKLVFDSVVFLPICAKKPK